MGKVRYLGSKTRIVNDIANLLGKPRQGQRFIDLFSGTGIVSQKMATCGWDIVANDVLLSSSMITLSKLINVEQLSSNFINNYERILNELNYLNGLEGFFFQQYSPSGKNDAKLSRPYFSIENAKKIDAVREEIYKLYLDNEITLLEKKLLLADLIEASNIVANIAGTYGCFLKNLSPTSLKPLHLKPRHISNLDINYEVHNIDAMKFEVEQDDVVYIDPPYTKRQYAAYYHIPETIANEDFPLVAGITGLRPWKDKSSDFCYKRKAGDAMRKLLNGLVSDRIIISYSSDGHISLDELVDITQMHGNVSIKKFENFVRYSPNEISIRNSAKKELTEYLIEIVK